MHTGSLSIEGTLVSTKVTLVDGADITKGEAKIITDDKVGGNK